MRTARRLTAPALLTLILALARLGSATAVGAMPAPPADSGGGVGQSPAPPAVIVTHAGSPVWTYIVVAVAAAVLTLALTWTLTRLRHSHAAHAAPVSAA